MEPKKFADQTTIQLIKALDLMETTATTDSLTGLLNFNYWHEVLPKLEKSGHKIYGVVSIDVNYLKRSNDEYGHSAGDRLLKDAAKILKDSFRAEDLVFRKGADEFAVILDINQSEFEAKYQSYLSHITDEEPLTREEYISNFVTTRIAASVEKFNQVHQTDRPLPLQLAFGVAASFPQHLSPPHNLHSVFDKADKRMYTHKNKHRSTEDYSI